MKKNVYRVPFPNGVLQKYGNMLKSYRHIQHKIVLNYHTLKHVQTQTVMMQFSVAREVSYGQLEEAKANIWLPKNFTVILSSQQLFLEDQTTCDGMQVDKVAEVF